jgi:hypothetical protein
VPPFLLLYIISNPGFPVYQTVPADNILIDTSNLYVRTHIMARTTFQGPVRSLGGIYQQGPAAVVDITSSTTLNPVDHGGRILAVGGSLAAALTLTLPAINVSTNSTTSGPGQDPSTVNNEGVVYTIWVPTTISTSSLKIGTNGTDKYIGTIVMNDVDSDGAALVGFSAAAANDFINLNGTTTGGVAGSWVQIFAIAANKYMVTGTVLGTGTVATPFANS